MARIDGLDSAAVAEAEPVSANTRVTTGFDGQNAPIATRLADRVVVHLADTSGTAMTAISGSGQQGVAGKELAKPVVLRVTDAAGNAVPNVRIMLRPSAGVLSDSAPATDAAGAVRTRWTLPAGAGSATFHLSAHVDGLVHPADVFATSVTAPATAHRHAATGRSS